MRSLRALPLLLAVAACTSFSGSDKSEPSSGDGADGGGNASGDGGGVAPGDSGSVEGIDGSAVGAAIDFDTCMGRVHVGEDFEGNTFPPTTWSDDSYGTPSTYSVTRDTSAANTGGASLKAHAISAMVPAGAALSYTCDKVPLPRGIRVKYAYKTTSSSLKGSQSYAEMGCDITFNVDTGNSNNSTEVAFNKGQPIVAVVKASQNLALGFESDAWHQVTQELRIDPTNPKSAPASLHAVVSVTGGTSDAKDVNATLSGDLTPVQIFCGIPYTENESGASTTIDAWVDDIVIDVCP